MNTARRGCEDAQRAGGQLREQVKQPSHQAASAIASAVSEHAAAAR